eukprot:4524815-Pyramimonas_sp.AAC.1
MVLVQQERRARRAVGWMAQHQARRRSARRAGIQLGGGVKAAAGRIGRLCSFSERLTSIATHDTIP